MYASLECKYVLNKYKAAIIIIYLEGGYHWEVGWGQVMEKSANKPSFGDTENLIKNHLLRVQLG